MNIIVFCDMGPAVWYKFADVTEAQIPSSFGLDGI
jgi:hypothetical protein